MKVAGEYLEKTVRKIQEVKDNKNLKQILSKQLPAQIKTLVVE